MPYPQTHILATVGGDISASTPNSSDIWQTSVRLAGGGGTEQPPNSVAELLFEAAADWFADTRNGFAPYCRLTFAKVALVGPDGRYVGTAEPGRFDGTPVVGPGLGQGFQQAPQISVVGTLLTNVRRGLASKGRMYLPPTSYSANSSTGRLNLAAAQGIATSLGLFLGAINSDVGAGQVSVMSKQGAGAYRPVIGVEVGTVFDTHRSRRNRLQEERAEAPID